MTLALALLIAGLLVDRALLVRSHRKDLERSGALDSQVIDFAERHSQRMVVQLEESRAQVSEMATRIQHPEVVRPEVRVRENQDTDPPYEDEYDLVGKILNENGNG